MAANPAPEDDERAAVMRFVEHFGLFLHQEGLPRMPAQVFAYVLADDAERYTAKDLADGLQVSPAAISGAVRVLLQAALLGREREPGSRVDHYRIYDSDIWSAIYDPRIAQLERSEAILQKFLDEMNPDRAGAQRVRETLEYFRFFQHEAAETMQRWRLYRAEHGLGVQHP